MSTVSAPPTRTMTTRNRRATRDPEHRGCHRSSKIRRPAGPTLRGVWMGRKRRTRRLDLETQHWALLAARVGGIPRSSGKHGQPPAHRRDRLLLYLLTDLESGDLAFGGRIGTHLSAKNGWRTRIVARLGRERAEVMVTVKTYPSPSDKYGETVCVAGVRTDTPSPSWIRLYPVRFRYSDGGYQFKKYERISVDIVAHGSKDPRVESYRPDADSIESLGVVQSDGDTWASRRVLVGDLIGETTTCALIATNRMSTMDQAAPSLGLVKPIVTRVELLQGEDWNPKQQAKVDRASQPT